MIKFFSFLNLLFFPFLVCHSQNTSIETNKIIVAYAFTETPLSILVDQVPCRQIFVSSRNCEVKKDPENPCGYLYTCNTHRKDELSVFKVVDIDTVFVEMRQVKTKPLPLSGRLQDRMSGDYISKDKLSKFPKGFDIYAWNTGLTLSIPIDSFCVQVRRNCEFSYQKCHAKGSDYTELVNEFGKTKEYDEVIFWPIWYSREDIAIPAPRMRFIVREPNEDGSYSEYFDEP